MNKKLVTTFGSLALVGVIGVGASLAYLSDKTQTLTNTFVIGNNIDITLDEALLKDGKPDGDKRLDADTEAQKQAYPEFVPGASFVKDPTTTVKANSNDCWVFMYVTGADSFNNLDVDDNGTADLAIGEWADNEWVKVDGKDTRDGWYGYFKKVEEKDYDQKLTPLFRSVNVGQYTSSLDDVKVPDIVVKSVAIQADGLTQEEAVEQLKNLPESLNK